MKKSLGFTIAFIEISQHVLKKNIINCTVFAQYYKLSYKYSYFNLPI